MCGERNEACRPPFRNKNLVDARRWPIAVSYKAHSTTKRNEAQIEERRGIEKLLEIPQSARTRASLTFSRLGLISGWLSSSVTPRRLLLATMSDDDDDEEDLWAEVDEPDSTITISSNLAAVIGVSEQKVHQGEPDEGKVRWVPPTFAGLSNSDTVNAKGAFADRVVPDVKAAAAASSTDAAKAATSKDAPVDATKAATSKDAPADATKAATSKDAPADATKAATSSKDASDATKAAASKGTPAGDPATKKVDAAASAATAPASGSATKAPASISKEEAAPAFSALNSLLNNPGGGIDWAAMAAAAPPVKSS